MAQTLYGILQIPPDASWRTIVAHYDGLRRPRNKLTYEEPTAEDHYNEEQRLNAIDYAFSILSDARSRYDYDMYLYDPQQSQQLEKSLHGKPVRNPRDTWLAARDGRVNSNGVRWTAPPRREESQVNNAHMAFINDSMEHENDNAHMEVDNADLESDNTHMEVDNAHMEFNNTHMSSTNDNMSPIELFPGKAEARRRLAQYLPAR